MPDGQMLEFTRVTKRFNDVTAVSDFSARVEPGVVTAFLGPNGAGKTTTLRILLGQVRPSSGTATIGGVPYADLRHPLRTIGAVLEDTVYRPRRTAVRQLTMAAKANGIPLSRVDEVLQLVGLEAESEARIGAYSLGMRQRLSVAHALLGDPGALVFDEPANGLDPEGIRWMRLLMRRLADEGRTVLVSSHVLSEVEQVADHVLVLSKGRLVLASGIEKLADPSVGSVVVDAADRVALRSALSAAGFEVEVLRSGLTVRGGQASAVGAIAASAGIALSTLVQRGPTLEDVFIELVRGGTLEPRAEAAATQLVAGADDADADAVDGAVPVSAATVPSDPIAAAVLEAGMGVAIEADAGADGVDMNVDVAGSEAEVIDTDAATTAAVAEADASPLDVDADDVESDAAAAEPGVEADVPAEETPADVEPEAVAEIEAGEAAPEEIAAGVDSDALTDEHAEAEVASDADGETPTAPSFDDILFGTAPQSVEPAESQEQGAAGESTDAHSGIEIFDAADDSDISENVETPDGGDVAEPSADDTPATGDVEDAASESEPADDDADPRTAAVSSMLAAAARAYYDDEPKDYPLGAASEGEGTDTDTDTADDGAHWSVAGTGVIDTVPAFEPLDDEAKAGSADEHSEHDESDK